MSKLFVVAIDGPAGAGKSTLGKLLAQALGLSYLDTGAHFRAVGVAAGRDAISFDDHDALGQLASSLYVDDAGGLFVADGEVTSLIRTVDAGEAASKVAVVPAVRAALADRQRAWAQHHGGGVIEGRDIGSVVFPDARLKLYITASPEVRGARRSKETGEDLDAVVAAIRERDERDRTRTEAPLQQGDSLRIDTSDRTLESLLEELYEHANNVRDGSAQ
jgi:CMP/dCMP kinase